MLIYRCYRMNLCFDAIDLGQRFNIPQSTSSHSSVSHAHISQLIPYQLFLPFKAMHISISLKGIETESNPGKLCYTLYTKACFYNSSIICFHSSSRLIPLHSQPFFTPISFHFTSASLFYAIHLIDVYYAFLTYISIYHRL